MSNSMWEEQHKPTQLSPPNSYHPNHSHVSNEYGSGKKSNMDQKRGIDGYALPPSLPRDYNDQGSVKGYGSGIKGYGSVVKRGYHGSTQASHDGTNNDYRNGGSDHRNDEHYGNSGGDYRDNEHCENGGNDNRDDEHGNARFFNSQNSSHHSSAKEFGCDHGSGRNIENIKRSSDCCYDGSDCANNDIHQHNNNVSNPKDYVRPSMSWLDRRSFYRGESCAVKLDWNHHPILRQVPLDEHQNYRHAKLEEWLSTAHKRRSNENFGTYIWRASALANSELRHRKKQCWGDEYENPLDKFVMRLFYGMKLKLERTESIVLGVDDETNILNILKEECDELSKNGQLPVDQRSIQYTPLIISEMQERSSIAKY